MRRLSLVWFVMALAGCDVLRESFTARPEVSARANAQTLPVERLATWAGTGKQVPLDAMALGRLAHVWVDYALFAQELAAGSDLRDSATVTAAMWPLVSQLKWEHFHDRLVAPRGGLAPAQVDSAFAAGAARVFQHILFQVPPSAAPTVDADKRRQAERVLVQARAAGAGFGRLAERFSDDAVSKAQGGSLGVSERGQFVQAFDEVAWGLAPGAVSPVFKSPFGYHIVRRPPYAEVRDAFAAGLEERLTYRADSIYLDSLSIKRRIALVKNATGLARTAAQDLEAARANGRAIAKYRGGAFRVRDLARWLAALDPQMVQALPQAADDQVTQFIRALAQRHVLLEQADSAGVTLTADDWTMMRTQHDSAVSVLGMILNMTPRTLVDSAATPEARIDLAMGRVNDYFARLVRGEARFYPIPPFLAEALRGRARWAVDQAGVRRALDQARGMRAAADSQVAPGVPRMTPAPTPGAAPGDTGRRSR